MPWLEILDGSDEGKAFHFSRKRIELGKKAEISIGDSWISKRHAVIFFDAGAFWIEDLKSSNGTSVGGSKIKKSQLPDGGEISLGKTRCRFSLKADDTLIARAVSLDDPVLSAVERAVASAGDAARAAGAAAKAARKAQPGLIRGILRRIVPTCLVLLLLAGGLVYFTLPLKSGEARLLLLAEYSKLAPLADLTVERTAGDTLLVTLPDRDSTVSRLVGDVSEVGLRYVSFPDAEVYRFEGFESYWRAILIYLNTVWPDMIDPPRTGTRVAVVQWEFGDAAGGERRWLDTPAGNGEDLYHQWLEGGEEESHLQASAIPVGSLKKGETRRFRLWGDQRGSFIGLMPEGWVPPQQE